MSILFSAFAVTAAIVQPAPASDASLEWLTGRWEGRGAVMGAPSRARLTVAPALGGRFTELRYGFETSGEKAMRFEGRAFYLVRGGQAQGRWLDSRGMMFPLAGRATNNSLSADWGDEGTERGRTTYRRLPDGNLEIVDQVRRADGSYGQFARHVLTAVR